MSCCRGLAGDVKAERQLVALLSMPLSKYDPVTVLSLDRYPALMALMAPRTHKDMAIKVVQTVLAQGTKVGGHAGPKINRLAPSITKQNARPAVPMAK